MKVFKNFLKVIQKIRKASSDNKKKGPHLLLDCKIRKGDQNLESLLKNQESD